MNAIDVAFVVVLLLALAQIVFSTIYVVRAVIKDFLTDKW